MQDTKSTGSFACSSMEGVGGSGRGNGGSGRGGLVHLLCVRMVSRADTVTVHGKPREHTTQ